MQNQTTIIHLTTTAGDITANVAERSDGRFAVTLRDNEAELVVPMCVIFDTRVLALEYAKRCVMRAELN